jgi:hypothetical protein
VASAVREVHPQHRAAELYRHLYREAAVRWIMLGVAIALLGWLVAFAGRVRHPQAVKRQWAVTASRVLAVTGGLVIVRLLLISYDERVPVVLFDLRSAVDPDMTIEAMRRSVGGLRAKGYEITALKDIIEFVEARRYVPKKCIGLVLEAGDVAQLGRARTALPDTEFAGLVPPTALEGGPASGFPAGVTMGLSLIGETVSPDGAGLPGLLQHLRIRSLEAIGCEPEYVRIASAGEAIPRGILKNTSYKCFLNGTGFNRFGDRPDILRLIDTGPIMGRARAASTIAAYVGLFRGRYYLWPAAAFLKLFGAGPEGV